jgi:hypothetical protein
MPSGRAPARPCRVFVNAPRGQTSANRSTTVTRSRAVVVDLPVANWTALGSPTNQRGYRYADRARLAGPINRVSVTRSGSISLAGGGATWPYTLDEPSQGAVAVRLRLGGRETWCTVFPPTPHAAGANDTVDRYVGAPNLPIPTACPPID